MAPGWCSAWVVVVALTAVPRADSQMVQKPVPAPTLATLSTTTVTSVNVVWASGTVPATTLHAGWLRERCLSAESVDQNTNQPLHAYHDFSPEALTIGSATIIGSALVVLFGDGHRSRFELDRIHAELSDSSSSFMQPSRYVVLPTTHWRANLTALPTFHHRDLATTDGKLSVVTQLLSSGLALIKGVPQISGSVVDLANNLSTSRTTNWGAFFNVKSGLGSNGDLAEGGADPEAGPVVLHDLAYTEKPIGFHTDNPYRASPPGFQLLLALEHCSCASAGAEPPCPACGVLNFAVDGFEVAEILRLEDPAGFQLLATVPVRFENNCGDDKSAMMRHAPIIELYPAGVGGDGGGGGPPPVPTTRDTAGNRGAAGTGAGAGTAQTKRRKISAINFSFKSGGYAPMLDDTVATAFYAARRRFSELLHDPRNTVSFQMEPGDAWVFDNQRVLHSRGPMGPVDGARWLQGAYMDRSMLEHNFERWRRLRAVAINPERPAYRMTPGGGFRSLSDGTQAELVDMGGMYKARVDGVAPERLLKMLESQKGDRLGQPIDLFEHGLQTASRAYRGGESEEMVVVSLLHDLTETIVSKNHGGVVAALLEPWISPKLRWMLEQHEVFQGKYYFHHFGADPDSRDRWRDHEFFNETARWCEDYDQASFDPVYPSLPLSFFAPMVGRILAKPAYWWAPAHPKKMAVTGA